MKPGRVDSAPTSMNFRARRDMGAGLGDGRIRGHEPPAVGKRIRRHVDDAHQQRARSDRRKKPVALGGGVRLHHAEGACCGGLCLSRVMTMPTAPSITSSFSTFTDTRVSWG